MTQCPHCGEYVRFKNNGQCPNCFNYKRNPVIPPRKVSCKQEAVLRAVLFELLEDILKKVTHEDEKAFIKRASIELGKGFLGFAIQIVKKYRPDFDVEKYGW